ncbi:MAG: cell division protein FtsL [Archangiaceae bacterium]|nr:cell division protein FtsL [Archangiaceae bacterium]
MSVVIEARNRGGLPLSVILGEILPAALAVMLLATVGIIHVTSRVLVVAQGYELSRLDAQSTDLMRENDQLKLELATLKGPQKLEAVARTKLGMVPPSPALVFHVKK